MTKANRLDTYNPIKQPTTPQRLDRLYRERVWRDERHELKWGIGWTRRRMRSVVALPGDAMTETERFCQDERAWEIVVGCQEGDESIVGRSVLR